MMRPTASLLVLCYNQHRFVRAAVAAALAQQGPPVEILISDDCSTDTTFDVIEAAVRDYDGPHAVTTHRNPQNLGLIAHINQAVDMATGNILIPAYGDDISFPDRAEKITAAFAAHDPLLVHSQAIPIDEAGQPCAFRYERSDLFFTDDPLRLASSLALYLGASGAWSRQLFDRYGPLPRGRGFDDHILGFRAALERRVHLIDEPLLYYRAGVGLSHDAPARPDAAQLRAERIKTQLRAIDVLAARLADARTFGLPDDHPIIARLGEKHLAARARLAFLRDRADLPGLLARHPAQVLKACTSEIVHRLRGR